MRKRERRIVPGLEPLEAREALSHAALSAAIPARRYSISDLHAFISNYNQARASGVYDPAMDLNHNGIIGQGDARLFLRQVTPLTRPGRLSVQVHLAPGEQARGTRVKNSGGITRRSEVTVQIRTTPGSVIFRDNPEGTYEFDGPALAADSNGNASYRLVLPERLTNTEYLVIDPYGRQTVRAFPILRLT